MATKTPALLAGLGASASATLTLMLWPAASVTLGAVTMMLARGKMLIFCDAMFGLKCAMSPPPTTKLQVSVVGALVAGAV